MRYDLYVEEVLRVCDTDKYRRSNDTEEEEPRDRCRSEAGGNHCGLYMGILYRTLLAWRRQGDSRDGPIISARIGLSTSADHCSLIL